MLSWGPRGQYDGLYYFQVKQIKLELHRSGSNILDSANELISHNNKRGQNLRTSQNPGEPVRVLRPATLLSAVDGGRDAPADS
jgi:hypothetical protein